MKRMVFSIFIFVAITYTCTAKIVIPAWEPEHLTRLYKATIDIVMTCYGDPGNAVGVVGDSDGSLLKALWSNYSIPVVLVDTAMTMDNSISFQRRNQLQVFVITATSPRRLFMLLSELMDTIWWTHYANFLIVHSTTDIVEQCSNARRYLYEVFTILGVLRAQFICIDSTMTVRIFNGNPFTRKAPEPWQFLRSYETTSTPFSLFERIYQEGVKNCDSLNFDKTNDLGGYPLQLMIPPGVIQSLVKGTFNMSILEGSSIEKNMAALFAQQHMWFVDNIAIGLNASTVICDVFNETGILAVGFHRGGGYVWHDRKVYTSYQFSVVAVTQHTPHKSQLEKILSVIDRESRIGMWIVYLISFLFFKFFLRLPVTPALLNLMRLTCNTGLPNLPQNFAPKIYLGCLFMFVITLQAIFTGDLASLLTKTVAYPHVNTVQDIIDLGYKIYSGFDCKNLLATKAIFDGHAITVPEDGCLENVLNDPLIACIMEYKIAVINAYDLKLHVSRETIHDEYMFYMLTEFNPLGRKLQARIRTWDECSLRPGENVFAHLHSRTVDDDEVNNNVVRRVMTMNDLKFAFVILGIGLSCSLVCFIGEIITHRIGLRIAKRRNRVRPRSDWGSTENKCLSFPRLKFGFNPLRLFSKSR